MNILEQRLIWQKQGFEFVAAFLQSSPRFVPLRKVSEIAAAFMILYIVIAVPWLNAKPDPDFHWFPVTHFWYLLVYASEKKARDGEHYY